MIHATNLIIEALLLSMLKWTGLQVSLMTLKLHEKWDLILAE